MQSPKSNWLVVLAVIGMVLPNQVIADAARQSIADVQLSRDNDLIGAVVDENGVPSANTPVVVMHGNSVIAQVKTDRSGRYMVQGLRPGLHVVRTVNNQQNCRFWTGNAAPPSARQGLLLKARTTVVRGQEPCGDEYIDCAEDCDGCAEGCGLFAGGLCSPGAIATLTIFSAATAVTIVSSTDSDTVTVPASP